MFYSDPEVAKFVLLMARAKIMQQSFRREKSSFERLAKRRRVTVADGWATITFLQLYLANIYVLIEVWDNSLLHDDAVYRLLKKANRRVLRRFRNAVFHATSYDHDDLAKVYTRYRAVCTWTDHFLDAIARFVRAELQRGGATKRVPA